MNTLTKEQCIEWLASHAFTEGRVPSKEVCGLLNRDVFPAILAHLRTSPVWLCVGDGENSGDTRFANNDAEIVQFLWDECGHDYTGDEQHARERWAEYIADEDNWMMVDGYGRWRCSIDVGETGHIMIQRIEPPRVGP